MKVFVYPAFIRLWHWINALSIVILAITGYLIANPLPSIHGEATFHYLMGNIRFLHFAAAYIFTIGLIARVYAAIVGNKYAKELFYFPFWNFQWWKELFLELQWYFFLKKQPKKYIGHNPLAQASIFTMYTLGACFMIVTGFALYSEGAGLGSWQDSLFGWVIPLFGQSYTVHTWHHIGMWYLIVFIILHIYAVIREDNMSRQTMVSVMINGYRYFKDDKED